ncbi:MAG: YgjV family protein [Ruminococcaceae bacterium]|nr:YgjV family protein [Oscillospiraceae bacterium]
MEILAQILGVLAVLAMLLSYQQKKRRGILLLGGMSRVLCVIQYVFVIVSILIGLIRYRENKE